MPDPTRRVAAVARIQSWFERLGQNDGQMAREDACFLMVQARHLVEARPDPSPSRVVGFYADWTVHTKLDRSVVCLEILRDITRVLADNFSTTHTDVTLEVSRVIGLHLLRSQLVALFKASGLPTAVFEYRVNWIGFVGFLLWLLEGQPIEFPAKRGNQVEAIYQEALQAGAPSGIVVEGLEIVRVGEKAHWMLHVGGKKRVRMVGQIGLADDPTSFLAPPTT